MSGATPRNRKKPVELFVSYSHFDAVWLGRLQPLLQFDHSRDKAYAWDDQKMRAGDRWDREIKGALERMDVFVCLVSTVFLTSRYIRSVELERALKREKAREIEIVPILIYPNVRLEDECAELEAFNPLPTWRKCWREYEGEPGDYGDAHGLIRAGLRAAIDKAMIRGAGYIRP
jgi:TIR domain